MNNAEAAQVMGMKTREVVEVVQEDGGTYARTHDGNWTFIDKDGVLTLKVAAPRRAAKADEPARVEPARTVEPAKTEPVKATPAKRN